MANAAPNKTETFEIMPPATAAAIEANKPKMVRMTLLRHYRPAGEFEVMGYNKEPVMRKRPDGKMVVTEPGGFITETDDSGKVMSAPAATPGTGFSDKILAGTVIRIGTDEAKTMRKNGIAEAEIED